MPGSVDEQVLRMRFDNQQFNDGIADSMLAVDKFKRVLDFSEQDGKQLTGIANSLDAIRNRFSFMGIVGMRTIENLTDGAIRLGQVLISKLNKPLNQIISGGTARAANIEQAKFQLKGLFGDSVEGAKKLQQAMEDADYAVSGTAYGLDSAAKAASQLSASGIKVGDEMKTALRGISGVAAMTNSSYDDMARIFATVAGNGRLMSEQLNSLGARGLNAAATLAKSLNVSEKELREMVSKGKISFRQFSQAMDDAFGEHAKDANATFTGSLSNINAALSRIGADFIAPLRDDAIPLFNAIRVSVDALRKAVSPLVDEFTKVSDVITGALTNMFNQITGGDKASKQFERSVFIVKLAMEELVFIFNQLVGTGYEIYRAFSYAFKIFDTNKSITAVFFGIMQFIDNTVVKLHAFFKEYKNFENVKNVFVGIMSTLSILYNVITSVGSGMYELMKYVFGLSGGFLELLGNLGLSIQRFDGYLKRTQLIQKTVATLVSFIISLTESVRKFAKSLSDSEGIKKLGDTISAIISSITEKFTTPGFSLFEVVLQKIAVVLDAVSYSVAHLVDILSNLGSNVIRFVSHAASVLKEGILSKIPNVIEVAEKLVDILSKISFDDVIKVEQLTGTVNAFLLLSHVGFSAFLNFQTLMDTLKIIFGQFESAVKMLSTVRGTILKIGNAFRDLSLTLKVDTIKLIGEALLKVAEAMFIFSLIDADGLERAITGVTFAMSELVLAFGMLTAITDSFGANAMKLASSVGVLTSLAVAIAMLSGSMILLSFVKPLKLLKSVVAVMATILALMVFVTSLNNVGGGLLQTSVLLLSLGAAIQMLTIPIIALSLVPWDKLKNGLIAFGVMMLSIMLYTETVGTQSASILASSAALILLATALTILAIPIKQLSELSLWGIIKALGALILSVAAFSGIMAGFGDVNTPGMLGAASAMTIMSVALNMMIKPIREISRIKFTSLIKSIGSLITLVTFLGGLMTGFGSINPGGMLAGAAAILVLSGALSMLVPALKGLTDINILQLAGSMFILVASMSAFYGISLAFAESIEVIATFVGLMVALGVSVLAAGAGLTFLGIGLSSLITSLLYLSTMSPTIVRSIFETIKAAIEEFLLLIPSVFLAISTALTTAAEPLVKAIGILLDSITKYLISDALPTFIESMFIFVDKLLDIFIQMGPGIIDKVWEHMMYMAKTVTIKTLSLIPWIVSVIIEGLITIIDSVSAWLEDESNAERLRSSIERFGESLATIIADVWEPLLRNTVEGVIKGALRVFDNPESWIGQARTKAENALSDYFGVGLYDDSYQVGEYVMQGLGDGINNNGSVAENAIRDASQNVINAAKEEYDINSPSEEFHKIGDWIMQGLGNGISDNSTKPIDALTSLTGSLLGTQIDFQNMSESSFAEYINNMLNMGKALDNAKPSEEYKVYKVKVADPTRGPNAYKFKNMKTTISKDKYGNVTYAKTEEVSEKEFNKYQKEKKKQEEELAKIEEEAKTESVATEEDKNKKKLLSNNKYWAELLKIRQNGVDAAKYQDMDLKEFEEDVFDQMKDIMKSYQDDVKDNISSMKNATSLFSEVDWGFDPENPVTKEKLTKNLEDQITQLARFTNVVNSLNSRIDNAELRSQIQEMGVGSLEELEVLNSMTEEELDHYEKLFEGKMEKAIAAGQAKSAEAKASAITQVNDVLGTSFTDMDDVEAMWNEHFSSLDNMIAANSANIGHNAVAGITSAMTDEEARKDIQDSTKESGEMIPEGYKDTLIIQSPSKVLHDEVGVYARLGITTALTDQDAETDYINTATRACQMIVGAFIGNSLYLEELGARIMDYVANGMNNNLTSIQDAINNMGMLLSAAGDAISNGSSPSVTPVWNGSNIQNGIAAMDKAFGATRTASLAAAASTYDVNTNKTITINDGKTVSAIEKLDRDINELWSQFNNLQVVMDGRALVGQIVAPMNQALGTYARQEARTGGM